MATSPVSKSMVKDIPGRTIYRTNAMGAGDDSAVIKGLIGNDNVIVSLVGTVTSVAVQTRMEDIDTWVPCNAAPIAAVGPTTYYNVMDQLRILVTTGTGVYGTIVVRRAG